ncbi:hypothetical protein THIOM_004500 [Candidatus Thiomargarita nelsonii]|uniref:Uncharacterized protein n=1 Tax=Candidatus Thiomargarita nelsonii TaxID=1003181 RepID=A0A176RVQ8_9GAMM|nr:hypothetical protein THIOM_004500 [Candidatus Thiomargarita nelsonii]
MNHKLIAVICILQLKRMSKATMMYQPYSVPPLKVKPVMHMVTWNIWKPVAIQLLVCQLVEPQII